MLSENGTRKGERAKKVPKYMQYDVKFKEPRTLITAFSLPPGRLSRRYHCPHSGKASHCCRNRTNRTPSSEIPLHPQPEYSLLHSELRDYDQHEQQERLSANLQNGPETDLTKVPPLQPAENAVQKAGGAQGGGKRVRDGG